MAKANFIKAFLVTIILLFQINTAFPCSSYKVTVNGSTMYGMNYDTWFNYPRIWFETNGYGAVFSGANGQGDSFSPQSGMNEYGLSFGTLATPTPANGKAYANKKQITSRENYLKDILHSCKTVDEVKTYIEQYDHSSLANDVFIYTEKSGKYLIVEPFTLTFGNDNKYVLANFCPSTITDFSSIKQERFIDGNAFLKNKIDTSLAFCTALSDTMHVCRAKIGDGTLLTSIYDLNRGNVHLYFYHDYNNQVQFNLKEELAKGDHSFEIPPLFPPNIEYQKLLDFKTPLNSKAVNWILRFGLLLFLVSGVYYFISYFRNRKIKYASTKLLLSGFSFVLMFYMFALAREMSIFYFPAPYKHYKLSMLDVVAYIPFFTLFIIIPLVLINRKIFKENVWRFIPKWLFAINNLTYLILIFLFAYWGFYNVLN